MMSIIGKLSLLALGSFIVGCSDSSSEANAVGWQGNVLTQESNNNGRLDTGEATKPSPSCSPTKNVCSDDLYVLWDICLVEKINGQEVVSEDLNGKQVCSLVRIDFKCFSSALEEGPPTCTGNYCSYLVASSQPGLCGWKTRHFTVYNADGSEQKNLTEDELRGFGYELLPIAP